MSYQIVFSEETFIKILNYKNDIIQKNISPGKYFKSKLIGIDLTKILIYDFVQLLLSTKKSCIFAESEVECDGSDWNTIEFSILGDINAVTRVSAFDNGVWISRSAIKYNEPLELTLLFTPGPMLEISTTGLNNPDYTECVKDNNFNQEGYSALIERRLLPLFHYVNKECEHVKAIIVIPGIGCGQFAGDFRGQMEHNLDKALQNLIQKNEFPNVKSVQLGLYQKTDLDLKKDINNITYQIRGNGLPQLSTPLTYGDEYKDCKIYKIVAWDHVSLPGNDFYDDNRRSTDDGVSAAATNSMEIITGVKGTYTKGCYMPPSEYEDWSEVVEKKFVQLKVTKNNIHVVSKNGTFCLLE